MCTGKWGWSSLLLRTCSDSLVPTGWHHLGSRVTCLHLVGKTHSLRPGSPYRSHLWLLKKLVLQPFLPLGGPPGSRVCLRHCLCPLVLSRPSKAQSRDRLPFSDYPNHLSLSCPIQWYHVDLTHCHLNCRVVSGMSLSHLLSYELLGRWHDSTYPPDVALSSSKMPFMVPMSIHSLTHSFNKLVLSACSVLATKLGTVSEW